MSVVYMYILCFSLSLNYSCYENVPREAWDTPFISTYRAKKLVSIEFKKCILQPAKLLISCHSNKLMSLVSTGLIEHLGECVKVQTLVLRDNFIDTIRNLECCHELWNIDLAGNKVDLDKCI